MSRFLNKNDKMYNLTCKNTSTGLKMPLFSIFQKLMSGGGGIFLCFLIGMLFFNGCKTEQIPVEVKYETRYTDSVRLKDSIVLIPRENIVDIVPIYDTLHLESTIAYSDAWIDTNYHIIKGQLVNKNEMLVEYRYVDRWKVKDSIVEREIPVYIKGDTVEVSHIPKWAWITLVWFVVTGALLVFKIYLRFKK